MTRNKHLSLLYFWERLLALYYHPTVKRRHALDVTEVIPHHGASADKPRRATHPMTTSHCSWSQVGSSEPSRMRDYDHWQYPDVQRVADETITFLRSFSNDSDVSKHKSASSRRKLALNLNLTQDLHAANVPPTPTTKTSPIDLNPTTGVENLPKRQSTHTTKYHDRDSTSVPLYDKTTSEPHSKSMERPLPIPNVTTQRQIEGKWYVDPKPEAQVRGKTSPGPQGGYFQDCVEPPQITDGVGDCYYQVDVRRMMTVIFPIFGRFKNQKTSKGGPL